MRLNVHGDEFMKRFILFAVVFLFGGIFSATAQDSDPAAGFIAEAERSATAQDSDPAAGFITEAGPVYYALNPKKWNIGVSLNMAGFIPFVGNGLSVSADFTKGRFNTKIDIHSGFGVLQSMFECPHLFGISANFHYFHPSRIGGFYAGVMLDYSFIRDNIRYNDYDDYYDEWHQFGLAGNFGYKFVTPSGVYFRTGAAVGWFFGEESFLLVRPDLSIGYNFGKKRQTPAPAAPLVQSPAPPARTPAAGTGVAVSAEPATPTHTGATASTVPAAPVRIAGPYTVEKCERAVRQDESRGGGFVVIGEGDILTDDIFVRVDRGSLVLTNGSTTVTIPAGRTGRVADLVTQR